MKQRWAWVLAAAAALTAVSCGGDSGLQCGTGTQSVNGVCIPTASGTVTCGANTTLMNGVCVAMPPGTTVTCGTGTELMSGMCVASQVTPTPPALSSVAVTGMSYDGDPTVALTPGHRLPLSFVILGTVRAGVMNPPTTPVQVSVKLVSVNADPAMRQRCAVNGEIVNVPGDGRAVTVSPEMVLPTNCLPAGATMGRFNVEVTLTMGATTNPLAAPTGMQTVLTFTSDRVTNAALPESQCRVIDGAADARCALELGLQRPAAPAATIVYGMDLDSAVGTLWPRTAPRDLTMGATEAARPNLALSLNTRAYGNDPNSQMDDALPGPVRVTVDVSPEEGNDVGHWEPVPFRRHVDGSDAAQTAMTFTSLDSASTDQNSIFLYLPDAIQERMISGTWRDVGIYRLRVCQTPMGWTSARVRGDEDPTLVGASELDGDGNCRTQRVRFALSTGATLSSARVSSWDLFRRVGGRNLSGSLHLNTTGTVAQATTTSSALGTVDLKLFGFDVRLVEASATANGVLATPATSRVSASLSVFNQRIFNATETLGTERDRTLTRMTSVMREFCRSKTVIVYVVPVTVEACLRGTLGLRGDVAVGGGTMGVPSEFMASPRHVYSRLAVTPSVDVGLGLSLGVGVEVLSAGVYSDVSVANFEVVVASTQRLGAADMQAPERGLSTISVNLGLTFLQGAFGLYAQLPVLGRAQLELARWEGIPGYGSRGSMVNVLNRTTPLFIF